jgi:hypothetical protein
MPRRCLVLSYADYGNCLNLVYFVPVFVVVGQVPRHTTVVAQHRLGVLNLAFEQTVRVRIVFVGIHFLQT